MSPQRSVHPTPDMARLFDLRPGAPAWQAYVVTPYPPKGGVDAREAAESVAAGLARRGYLGGGR